MAVLIDGYNLLRAIQKISDNESMTDVQLCRMISNYLRYIGEAGEIVFDGVGPREKAVFFNMAAIDVIFSGQGIEADAVIEEKIAAYSAPKLMLVVSSDRRLRLAAAKRKAIAVKAEQFWQVLEKFTKQSLRRKKFAEPREKREGISEGEVEYWMKVFGLSNKSHDTDVKG